MAGNKLTIEEISEAIDELSYEEKLVVKERLDRKIEEQREKGIISEKPKWNIKPEDIGFTKEMLEAIERDFEETRKAREKIDLMKVYEDIKKLQAKIPPGGRDSTEILREWRDKRH